MCLGNYKENSSSNRNSKTESILAEKTRGPRTEDSVGHQDFGCGGYYSAMETSHRDLTRGAKYNLLCAYVIYFMFYIY